MNIIKSIKNLTKTEKILWIGSLLVVFISSVLSPGTNWLSAITSLVGAMALIFVCKGDPVGQLISIVFALLYAVVSFRFRYYGEMITYLGMSLPATAWALVTWLRNPYTKREVKVASMTARKWILLLLASVLVTLVMWKVLAFFKTANLTVSTISVTTSFLASMLLALRSPYYAIFYAANDIVLIVLWVLATLTKIGYLPMVLCFVIFLVNDMYGFINWRRMKRRQKEEQQDI